VSNTTSIRGLPPKELINTITLSEEIRAYEGCVDYYANRLLWANDNYSKNAYSLSIKALINARAKKIIRDYCT